MDSRGKTSVTVFTVVILPNSGTGQKGLRTPTMWFPLMLFWFAVHLLIFVTFPRQMVDLQVFEWEEKTLKESFAVLNSFIHISAMKGFVF